MHHYSVLIRGMVHVQLASCIGHRECKEKMEQMETKETWGSLEDKACL